MWEISEIIKYRIIFGSCMVRIETARKFTFDVGWVFTSLAAAMVTGLILRILLGNFFDASGLGTYSMVFTIWTIVTLTAGLGIPGTVVKYVAEFKDRENVRNTLASTAIRFRNLDISYTMGHIHDVRKGEHADPGD